MNYQILRKLMILKGLKSSALARMACVSRTAVSKWLSHRRKKEWINIETKTLLTLADSLKIDPAILLTKPIDISPLETRFIWDHLYPNMETFVKALDEERPVAIARLVQILGFQQSINVIGKKAVLSFVKYKKYLKPIRRKQLEIIWPLYSSQI